MLLAQGTYHLYVSEMTQGCGLIDWMTNTQVVHATSPSPEGPFVKRDVAVLPFSTNPQAIQDRAEEFDILAPFLEPVAEDPKGFLGWLDKALEKL